MSVIKANGAGDQSLGFYNGVATQSLRFDRASDPYLNRTATLGNRKTWTFSTWLKRSGFTSAVQYIFGTNVSNNDATSASIFIGSDNKIYVVPWSNHFVNTDAVLRDVGAWYHIVVDFDTTQAGSANADRVNIYINGVDQPLTNGGATLGLNTDWAINLNQANTRIGDLYGDANELDGYLAETNFVDGLSLDASYFGETKNGVWIPKTPNVSDYGTNGFRLQFNADGLNESSGTVSSPTNIGDDSSGKNNHFSVSGIVASDCNMPDSPENNFATINPLHFRVSNGTQTYSEGNLKYGQPTANSWGFGFTTLNVKSGKWYAELRCAGNTSVNAGVANVGHYGYHKFVSDQNPQNETGIWQLTMDGTATKTRFNNSPASATYTGFGNGQILGILLNADDKELSFTVDGTLQTGFGSSGVVDISTGGSASDEWSFFANTYYGSSETMTWNFGQDSSFLGTETATSNADANGNGTFHTAPPSGYLALCTANFPEPTIGANSDTQADDHFNSVIYNGLNSTAQDITVGFVPDWVWIKTRNAAISNMLYDSSRGATKFLQADATGAEGTGSDSLTDFDVSGGGFSLGADSSTTAVNNNGKTYVAWNWKANGGTTTTNDASSTGIGDRDSVYQANTTAGFSIVTYTGSGQTGAGNDDTYAHGLQVNGVATTPEVIICKNRQTTDAWLFGATAIPSFDWANDYMHFNDTIAHQTNANRSAFSVAPTSTVFSVGEFLNKTNNYVAYLFASVEGYSKFGSYTGNGNADGSFIYLGFRPAFIMSKKTSGTGNWEMFDTTRDPINYSGKYILANSSDQEGDTGTNTAGHIFDILSNGFKLRNTNSDRNSSGGTYIYMAFAEAPFKYANAR